MDRTCENLKALQNINNSCYLDSVIVALFAVSNNYLDQAILNTRLQKRMGTNLTCSLTNDADEDLRNRIEIQKEVKKIVYYMRGESTEERKYCTDLRRMLFTNCKQPDKDISIRTSPEKRMMDSSEFMDFFLNIFDTKVLRTKIQQYFNDVLESESERMENIMWGPFAISDTKKEYDIQDFLKTVSTNVVTDERVGIKTEIVEVYSTPILIVRIERYDKDVGLISASVTFPETITLLSGQTLTLSAIVCYRNNHYVCFILCNDKWYLYDDTNKKKLFSEIGDYSSLLKYRYYTPSKTGTLFIYKDQKYRRRC
jgi:hypothetical protein